MKKIALIILINILIFFIAFCSYDYITAQKNFNNHYSELEKKNKNSKQNPCHRPFKYSLQIKSYDSIWEIRKKYILKTNENSYTQSPILLFGCSFAAGSVKENFARQISEKTKRPTYNFGFSGLGIANMYSQISQPDFFDILDKIETPEHVFYIYISDHIYRLYSDRYGLMTQIYIDDDIQQPNIKTHFIRQAVRFYTLRRYIESALHHKKFKKEFNDKNFNLLIQYFKKSKEKLSQKYPNIKFIILKYPTTGIGYLEHKELYNSEKWNKLSKEGFIVIDLKDYVDVDLTNEKYIFSDYHPNKEAWDVITDKLAKDINNGKI